jgi:hypothetical protein
MLRKIKEKSSYDYKAPCLSQEHNFPMHLYLEPGII